MKFGPSLHLRNFQAWADGDIPIVPGITVFVGPTGAGKSTILRGLRGLLFNDVDWDRMRRRGTKEPVLVAAGGLVRERGARCNAYTLPDGQVLGQIGKGVPEAVQALTGVRELELESGGKIRLHFGGQFGGATFLVTDDPKTTASVLGRLIGTTAIYAAEREARSQLRAVQAEARTAQQALEAAQAELNKLAWVPDLQRRFVRWQHRRAEVETRGAELDAARDLLVRAKHWARIRKQAQQWGALRVPDVASVKERGRRLSRMQEVLASSTTLKALAEAKLPTMPALDLARLRSMQATHGRGLTLTATRDRLAAAVLDAEASCEKAKAVLAAAWQETQTCPLCRQPVQR